MPQCPIDPMPRLAQWPIGPLTPQTLSFVLTVYLLSTYYVQTLNNVLDMAGVSRMTELPDARKRPRQEEECQYEECGKVSDEVIAHYNEPALCNPLREQARADLDALKEKLGIVTPSRWAKFCGSNHEGVTPYAAGAYKSYTKQPSNHGANLEQRHLSTDNSVEGERERMRIS